MSWCVPLSIQQLSGHCLIVKWKLHGVVANIIFVGNIY